MDTSAVKYSSIDLEENTGLYIAHFCDNMALLKDSSVLTTKELEHFNNIPNNRRKEEYLLVRWLAKEILDRNISYRDGGAPYLEGDKREISISHCSTTVAIMVSTLPCGVDIEQTHRNFERAAKRFVTPNDRPIANKEELARYWCTKEAVYKAHRGDIDDILLDIVIEEIEDKRVYTRVDGRSITADIIYKDSLIISHTVIK